MKVVMVTGNRTVAAMKRWTVKDTDDGMDSDGSSSSSEDARNFSTNGPVEVEVEAYGNHLVFWPHVPVWGVIIFGYEKERKDRGSCSSRT